MMFKCLYSLLVGSMLAATAVLAQVIPLTDRRYQYPSQIPYKVDTDTTGRGPQFGYTLCNSTTQNQLSNCQLGMVNAIDDFCLWGPPVANSTIGDTEAATVAWCTKPNHGTRVIPGATLTGVQFLRAPAYLLVVGRLNQINVDIQVGDTGGEMDPHGADERGNPLGGLVYTSGFPSNNGNNNSFQQVIEWHNFMGSNLFCFKVCDPAVAGSKAFCNNVFDLTGCGFVAPASYQDGVFESCDSDNMDPVGVYTGSNGVVSTFKQPSVITSLPSVRTPASSNCVTYTSSVIYAAEATVTGPVGRTTSTTSKGTSTGTKGTGTTSSVKSTTTATNAAKRVRSLEAVGLGVGPVMAIAVSFLAGFGAVAVGL